MKIQMYLLSALLVLLTVSATYGQVASRYRVRFGMQQMQSCQTSA